MSRLTLILIAALLAGPAAAERAASAPTAREVVERQLAKKPAAAPPPGLTAQEADAIRAQYLKRIGSAPIVAGAGISSARSR